jgi:hypothetical protein
VSRAAERRHDDLVHDLAQKKFLAALRQRKQVPRAGDRGAERNREGKMEALDERKVALAPQKQQRCKSGECGADRALG